MELPQGLEANIDRFIREQTSFAARNGRNAFEDGTDLARALNLLAAIQRAVRKAKTYGDK